jgi:hypothetical protein
MKNTLFYSIVNTKRAHEDKVWIKLSEFNLFLSVLLWSLGLNSFKREFNQMLMSIKKLVSNCGYSFTFSYLKEVMRIVTRILAKAEVEKSTKIFVKVDKFGLPCIIPYRLRDALYNKKGYSSNYVNNIAKGVLTLLSIHRVFPVIVEASLDTVVNEFAGISKILSPDTISKGVKNLLTTPLSSFNPTWYNVRWIWADSSGPNSTVAGWGIILDTLALLHNKNTLRGVLLTLVRGHRWDMITFIILTFVIWALPYLYFLHKGVIQRCELGRLGVVYNQAGKARVVAITSYWVQVCLKPVHEVLFRILKKIPDIDGTFNQISPLTRLISSKSRDEIMRGFDLSAATDRLPLDLQKQVISCLGYDAELWGDLLGVEWFVPFKHKGSEEKYVKYSVGQPMGAYSSWAMLAITHHVIVQYAALNAGHKGLFTDYCVLGDDVVISNDVVADGYLELMKVLGLEINRQKSVESSVFTEFAKKLMGPGVDISPLGAGLIIQTIRTKAYAIRYIQELYTLGVVSFNNLPDFIGRSPSFMRKRLDLSVWSVIIGCFANFYAMNTSFAASAMSSHPLEMFTIRSHCEVLYRPALSLLERDWWIWLRGTNRSLNEFLGGLFIHYYGRKGGFFIHPIMNVINPGTYIILGRFVAMYVKLIRMSALIWWDLKEREDTQSERLSNLADVMKVYDTLTLLNVDYTKKTEVKDATKATSMLLKEAQKLGAVRTWKSSSHTVYTPLFSLNRSVKRIMRLMP